MEQYQVLTDILIFLGAAIIVVPLFHQFKISPILGYMLAGVLIGPSAFALIDNSDNAHTLAEFGVVFLLFMIGLELSVERLRAIGGRIFLLGLLQVVVTSIIITFAALALGMSPAAAAIIGGGLALSSTAFVMKYLSETGERATRFGLIVFAILLVQDLAVVPFLILVPLLAEQDASFIDAFTMAAFKGAIALVIVTILGRFLLKPLYQMIANARSSELFIATTLLVVLGTGWIMSVAGLSMTLGAFLAGLMLSGTQYRHQIEADIRPFRGILLGLFFMIIGMSMDILLILEQWAIVLSLLVALMLGKTLVTAALSRLLGTPASRSIRVGLALSQGGEFGFVMFGAALALQLIDAQIASILLAVIALSMIATPAMFALGRTISNRTKPSSIASLSKGIQHDIGEDETGHVLIAGFGRVGQTVAKVVSDAGVPYVALDLDQTRLNACSSKGMSVFYGDADQIKVLQAAGAGRARSAVITLDKEKTASSVVAALRQNYPDLPIYVRARDRAHSNALERAGATAMVFEAAEASLQLGSIVLASLDVGTDDITSIINNYREDDYALLEDVVDGDTQPKPAPDTN
ncbi:MAG: monovalent cation:proton antiporter-2 (CPA2) family protein [Devosiaceae bacterium]|nr:monovalent cation:proton antiporter-2 (CPA2) family protein [Devosiaceae bacterium]